MPCLRRSCVYRPLFMASKLGSSFSGSSGLPRKLIGFKNGPKWFSGVRLGVG